MYAHTYIYSCTIMMGCGEGMGGVGVGAVKPPKA